MQIEQRQWTAAGGWAAPQGPALGARAQLVLVFGARRLLSAPDGFAAVRRAYPGAHVFCCSTAGEIYGTLVSDDSLITTAISFERSHLQTACIRLADAGGSFAAGARLAGELDPAGLVHVFVLSDGLQVNGSQLVQGLVAHLPPAVAVTGGLSADGPHFEQTLVGLDTAPEPGAIGVVGFYGAHLRVGYGSLGGWDPFGPERLITRAAGNVLYELDGHSALALYKRYLGSYADGLPATGLLFPLSLRTAGGETGVVRTILATDEAQQSLTFAGDVPQGAYARLMKANFERLIDGATAAARTSCVALGSATPDLAVLISCVGRKLVL